MRKKNFCYRWGCWTKGLFTPQLWAFGNVLFSTFAWNGVFAILNSIHASRWQNQKLQNYCKHTVYVHARSYAIGVNAVSQLCENFLDFFSFDSFRASCKVICDFRHFYIVHGKKNYEFNCIYLCTYIFYIKYIIVINKFIVKTTKIILVKVTTFWQIITYILTLTLTYCLCPDNNYKIKYSIYVYIYIFFPCKIIYLR